MPHIIKKKFGCFPKISCLDHGFVHLIDCMPALVPENEDTADYAIAEAARCSYQRGTKTVNDDKSLIRYLIRNDHSSPLEMVEFKFHIKMPLFVARQWLRHRTASLNELSGRYSEMPEEFYTPELSEMRSQGTLNKQGSNDATIANSNNIHKIIIETCSEGFNNYQKCLSSGLARELSRIILPLATYSEMYWKIDLKNLLHLLDLRCDNHAQKEIRIYAQAVLDLITPIVPYTIAAWNDYSQYRNGMKLSAMEIEALRDFLANPDSDHRPENMSENEKKQWQEKLKFLQDKG